MMQLNDIGALQVSMSTGFARYRRNLEMRRDVAKGEIRFYDHEYGIELGTLKESRMRFANRSEMERLVREACREPTSLEILYYAQIGGPHVRGVE